MPEYKSYQLVGGKPVTIEPLTVGEAGTTFAKEGRAFNPVICTADGNPNSVEMVEGTLANPWGDAFDDFKEAAMTNIYGVSAELAVDATAMGMGTVYLNWDRNSSGGTQFSSATLDATLADGRAARVLYTGLDGTTLNRALILMGGSIVDMSTYASALPTTLTIVYHPLPI